MRYQTAPNRCGPAAVINALRAMGLKVREEQAAQYAGTIPDGTNEFGIMAALERYGCPFQPISERKYALAEAALFNHLRHGPVLVLAEAGDHWVTAIGLMGDRVVIFDSQNRAFNRAENGVHMIQKGEQLRRYWLPCESKRYAILVWPPA